MSIDLSKTYTVKSNATRDMRKAVASGAFAADALGVVVVPSGYRIVSTALPAGATRTEPIPGVPLAVTDETISMVPAAPYDPASLKQATNLVNGAPVSVANLHPPVRSVAGDPEKAARKAARASTAGLQAARKAAAKMDRAIGSAPAVRNRREVGVRPVRKPAAQPAASMAAVRPAAVPGALSEAQLRLLGALIDARAFNDLPLAERAGVWIKYKALHDTNTPHNLAKGQLPGLTGGLRRRGLIDIRGNSATGEVQVTLAGLTAYLHRDDTATAA